jgi:hypothetical protein
LLRKARKIGARLETSTRISLVRSAQKQGVNASSARNATKQMHLYIHIRQLWLTKPTIRILNFFQQDSAAAQRGFCNKFGVASCLAVCEPPETCGRPGRVRNLASRAGK